MSSAIQGLKNILLELESYDESQLPPYRHDEIRAAETALASARVDYRALLVHHKMSVEKCVESLQSTSREETGEVTTVEDLKRLCVMPDVALCIMTSRYQQIDRGLRIYRFKRAIRLVNVALALCLNKARSIDDALAAKMSVAEQQILSRLLQILSEYGLYDKMKDLPKHPSGDRGRAWMEPPTWLKDIRDSLCKENSDEANQILECLGAWQNLDYDYRDFRI